MLVNLKRVRSSKIGTIDFIGNNSMRFHRYCPSVALMNLIQQREQAFYFGQLVKEVRGVSSVYVRTCQKRAKSRLFQSQT